LGAFGLRLSLAGQPEKPSEEFKTSVAGPSTDASGEPALELSDKQNAAIKIEKVGEKTFEQEREAIGNIDFNQNLSVQVFTPYQGRIIDAYPNIGDKVEKDQVLFTIDSPDLLAAESNLIAAAGVLELQSRTLARLQSLIKIGGVSQQNVDQTTSDQMTAEGTLKSARDAVRIFGKTEAEIDGIVAGRRADPKLVVKSPISGYVTARTAQPGLLVQPGNTPAPFTVADMSTMWMFANVVESDAPYLHVGQTLHAQVSAYPGRDFAGVVTVISPSVDPNSRRVFVRTEIKDPDHLLRAGMLTNFKIRVSEPTRSPAVPVRAIIREGDGTFSVWTTKDKRHFVEETVKIGLEQDDFFQVVEGLKPGELVVTENGTFLSAKYAGGGPSD
jgi:cobalt-zinc-cadmium efflux system membrane fusion protein